MSRHATEETLHDHVKHLQETIDLLIDSLRCERARWPTLANEFSARYGDKKTIAILRQRTQRIIEQVSF
jgi:hypothetical protein